ncbi:hypothetical protein F511_12755 [Dorcoceras hygrometricum]|uniref:Uncharacterized protein n=1 Tax=Dorcoceras hygrometricum TaxID=472368 RepID=A0A2Z7CY04_9LAMI|nr:hypothetical protein F511_12755 [Dorcoceras hygrometricum]
MVVDLIGIYGLKGPYCTLTTTNWFLQALSVIPRGSWGDVARRFTMIRWAAAAAARPPCAAAARLRRKIVSGHFDEENPFVLISSVLLVLADEGVSFMVVDRIGDIYRNLPRRADVIVTTVGARHKCQQELKTKFRNRSRRPPPSAVAHPPRAIVRARHRDDRDMDAHVARPGGDDGRKLLRNASAGSAVPCAASGDRWSPPRTGCRAPLRRSTRLLHAMLRRWLADARCWIARKMLRVDRGGAPLVDARWAAPERAIIARWPDAVERRCAAEARCCARRRALPPRSSWWWRRRPAAAPACLRRCRDGWSDFF